MTRVKLFSSFLFFLSDQNSITFSSPAREVAKGMRKGIFHHNPITLITLKVVISGELNDK